MSAVDNDNNPRQICFDCCDFTRTYNDGLNSLCWSCFQKRGIKRIVRKYNFDIVSLTTDKIQSRINKWIEVGVRSGLIPDMLIDINIINDRIDKCSR